MRWKTQGLSGLLAVVVTMVMMSSSGCSEKVASVITDASGERLATITGMEAGNVDCVDEGYQAYADVVIAEAVDILCDIQDCSQEKAETLLLSKGYTIQTAFDQQVFRAVSGACRDDNFQNAAVGVAITDLKGRLLSVISADDGAQEYVNHAQTKTYPGSTLKPLSVYAPAMEKGLINWSAMFEDAPVKQVTTENGRVSDWPANANGVYTRQNISVCKAIKGSVNTVAVRCLQRLGADASMKFLRESFGLDLTVEEELFSRFGEEEVLGNLALGYLHSGVSPIDMAGYYQIFATGGVYTAPYTVLQIMDANGISVYTAGSTETRVLQETTAYVMNQLLQEVVGLGGTGEAAYCGDIPVAGKTGTSDNNQDNWFVGVTPQYSCAVWHDEKAAQNQAAALFGTIMPLLNPDSEQGFPTCSGVVQKAYCDDSGDVLSTSCSRMEVGYFVAKDSLPTCRQHTAGIF